MRQKLLRDGANELTYEIRGIVRKAEQLIDLGYEILWENIGDPIQKNHTLKDWMKVIIAGLMYEDVSYAYSHSKGLLSTRQFLAELSNSRGGVQIGPEDITFFNGLGDAIAKVYQYLLPSARVIGPSPAYSTHSSSEAAHANNHPITYKLDPENSWYPDIKTLREQVIANPDIVAILIINPDNPTGMVYPREVLEKMVAIAREFNLFIICDEIYMNIVYNGAKSCPLAEVIGEVPAISLKGISKEFPWPGSRCGWAEYYNRKADPEFEKLCETIDNAKMIEVSSTRLPQMAIPKIMGDDRYPDFLREQQDRIGKRGAYLNEVFKEVPYITFNQTNGAFYNTMIFKPGVLNNNQKLKIEDERVQKLLDSWLEDNQMTPDKRFVYYLLAAKQVCLVPISSFASDLLGFRLTLLEEGKGLIEETFQRIKDGVIEYCESA